MTTKTSSLATILRTGALALVAACAPSAPRASVDAPTASASASPSVFAPTVHRVAEEGMGSVNSYIIEGAQALVMIDAQRSISAAKRVLEAARAIGKPIEAVLLTHAHPDHYNGLGVFTEAVPGLSVYASATTRAIIAEDRFGYHAATRRALPDDSFETATVPTHTFVDGQELVLGGVTIRAVSLGHGEGEDMTMFVVPEHGWVFTGDLLANGMTPFLLEGRLDDWREQLRVVGPAYPGATAFPGHGRRGSLAELVAAQAAYLRDFEDVVRLQLASGEWSEAARSEVVAQIEQRYPGYVPVAAIPELLALNADAVAAALAQR